jgi:hypothetical protein
LSHPSNQTNATTTSPTPDTLLSKCETLQERAPSWPPRSRPPASCSAIDVFPFLTTSDLPPGDNRG